jgi:hypothetical protein
MLGPVDELATRRFLIVSMKDSGEAAGLICTLLLYLAML